MKEIGAMAVCEIYSFSVPSEKLFVNAPPIMQFDNLALEPLDYYLYFIIHLKHNPVIASLK